MPAAFTETERAIERLEREIASLKRWLSEANEPGNDRPGFRAVVSTEAGNVARAALTLAIVAAVEAK